MAIAEVLSHYHPEFEAPEDEKLGEWQRVKCPFHDDNKASAGINYELDSFSCLACGVAGNAWTLILQQEGTYAKAKRVAKGVAPDGDRPVPPSPAGEQGRRVFGDPRRARGERPRTDGPVSSGIRGRTTPWT